jgi:prolipoprotein diacylglyceryltransferase
LAIGIAFGRIGCFLNGCCYGIPANAPWGVAFKGIVSHPTQIYESLFSFLLFIFLWSMRTRFKKEGDLFKVFLLLYAFFRFWIEFLRADAVKTVFGVSLAQVISLIVFMTIGIYFIRRRSCVKRQV